MMVASPAGASMPEGEIGERISDQKKSFHTNENIKTPNAAMAGLTKCKTILKKIDNSLAQSTRADSSNSLGICEMKLRMKKIQNPA